MTTTARDNAPMQASNGTTLPRTSRGRRQKRIRLLREMLGADLAAIRQERGITQEGLADLMKRTRECVSSWESGRASPSAPVLHALISWVTTS